MEKNKNSRKKPQLLESSVSDISKKCLKKNLLYVDLIWISMKFFEPPRPFSPDWLPSW